MQCLDIFLVPLNKSIASLSLAKLERAKEYTRGWKESKRWPECAGCDGIWKQITQRVGSGLNDFLSMIQTD